ncbi:MAG: DIP1984 family protein [Ruminococcus sp.]|nr:DIP1984 family protein [Ruminococcus sp.]
MKLAEALNERADLQKRIEQLRVRLNNNAKVQEGEKPNEDPAELLSELGSCCERLRELIVRINHTNSVTIIEGETISSLIAQKDVLTLEISVKRGLTEAAALNYRRMSACEVKIYPTVNVRELQKEIDRLSGQLRALDTKIQAANWNTDLL